MASKKKAHAELSASGSSRWLNCPGSVRLSRTVPPLPDTKYSIEGTKAHGLLEIWLKHIITSKFTFPIPKGYPKGMVASVRVCVDETKQIWANGKTGTLEAESRISLSHIVPDGFGTGDIRIIEHYGILYVLDYKHGYHPVEVREPNGTHNTQLIYYGLGSAFEFNYDFDKVVIGVIQPRALHHEGPVRLSTLKMKELRAYEPLFARGAERTEKKDAKTFAGKWCKWCPCTVVDERTGRPVCKSFAKYATSEAAKAFADFDIED